MPRQVALTVEEVVFKPVFIYLFYLFISLSYVFSLSRSLFLTFLSVCFCFLSLYCLSVASLASTISLFLYFDCFVSFFMSHFLLLSLALSGFSALLSFFPSPLWLYWCYVLLMAEYFLSCSLPCTISLYQINTRC